MTHTAIPTEELYEGTENILIVDDDAAVLKALSTWLRNRGYNVLTATNGEDALRVADRREHPVHLIVSDLVMPEMNGVQLFARLKGWFPEARFLFISGYVDHFDPAIAAEPRAAFLAKPFTLARLAEAGRRLLDQPRPRITQPRLRPFAAS